MPSACKKVIRLSPNTAGTVQFQISWNTRTNIAKPISTAAIATAVAAVGSIVPPSDPAPMPALLFPNPRLDQAVAGSRGVAQPSMGAAVVQCASVLRRSGVGQPTSWRWQPGAKHGNVLIRGYRPRRPVSRAARRKGELHKLAAHGEGQAMPIEVIIIWLVVGAIAGWLAGVIVTGGGFGLDRRHHHRHHRCRGRRLAAAAARHLHRRRLHRRDHQRLDRRRDRVAGGAPGQTVALGIPEAHSASGTPPGCRSFCHPGPCARDPANH